MSRLRHGHSFRPEWAPVLGVKRLVGRVIPSYTSVVNDDQLWTAFQASALSAGQWTHEAHVRTAFLFMQRFSLDEAHLRMRAGIVRLNERHGLIETGSRGYFETLTRVWLVLVAHARARSLAQDSEQLLARCPELMDRTLPLRYYSRALLATPRARAIFVAPDLAPLPAVDE